MDSLSTYASFLISDLKTVGIQFYSPLQEDYCGNVFHYKTLDDFEVGDLVIVPCRNWLQVVKVTEVHETPSLEKATKWIVCKLDDKEYQQQLIEDARILATLKELQHKAYKLNALQLLADQAGISVDELRSAVVSNKELAPE